MQKAGSETNMEGTLNLTNRGSDKRKLPSGTADRLFRNT
jgi:hypothetical protein